MVECSGLAAQGRQIVDRVEDQRASLQGPRVGRDDLAAGHDHDPVDVALDRHHLERERPRNAVPIAIEGDGLVLVHRGRGTDHAGIEPIVGKRRRRGLFFGERVPILNGPKSD